MTAINTDRARVALTPLTWNSQLGANACAHARQMAATHVYAHQDLQALSETAPYAVFDRLAENLYTNASVQTAEAVEATFMGSGEHRSNILGPFRWIGVCSATSTDGAFWVAVELGG